MKIAYYSNATFPSKAANRVHIIRMCEAFAKAGHKVTLFCTEKPKKSLLEGYGITHPFKVTAKPTYSGKNLLLRLLFFILKLLKILLGNYDFIIFRSSDNVINFTYNPIALERHSFQSNKKTRSYVKVPNLAVIQVITEPLRQAYEKEYPLIAKKILVAPDAATVPSECYISDASRCETVGYVGHLYEGRGIEIVAGLAEAFPQLKFVVIGGEEEHVNMWKERYPKIANLIFHGYVPHGKLGEHYKDIDIVLAPYQENVRIGNCTDVDTSQHMSPLKIFEYMAFKKPMLVSDSPVLYEVLRDEENCLICEKANIDSWKKQLQRLVDDGDLRKKISRQAYDDFTENYTWDVRVRRLLEFVEKQDMPKRGMCRGFLHISATIFAMLRKRIRGRIYKFFVKDYPWILPAKWFIKLRWPVINGKKLDLKTPETFNEKLQWLKLHDRNPLYCKITDKYEVRQWITDTIGSEYLIPLLGVWDGFEDIDFDKLPNQFVLKTTHFSGDIIICKDKSTFDIEAAREKIKYTLKRNIYYISRQWPHKNQKPRIIAEKYMEDEYGELRDYKLLCFSGQVKFIWIDVGRFNNHMRNLYTAEWAYVPITYAYPTNPKMQIPRPENLEKMIRVAEILAKSTPFSRVDLYSVNSKIYFGEITLYPHKGTGRMIHQSFDKTLGEWLYLPTKQELRKRYSK